MRRVCTQVWEATSPPSPPPRAESLTIRCPAHTPAAALSYLCEIQKFKNIRLVCGPAIEGEMEMESLNRGKG